MNANANANPDANARARARARAAARSASGPAVRLPANAWTFLPELDGLRAVSVLLVLVSHLGFGLGRIVPGGLGVTVFFFISGFIITRLLLAEYDASGTISLRNFYARRMLRLGPALMVYLAVSLACMIAVGWKFSFAEPLSVLLYYANYYHIYVGFSAHDNVWSPFGVLWSLSVEEHFYMLFPLLLLAMAGTRSRLMWLLAGSLVLALGWRLWLAFGVGVEHLPDDRMFKGTDTRFDSIIFGCVAALLFNRYGARMVRWCAHPLTLAVAVLALLLSLAVRDPAFRESFRYSLQGFAIVMLAITLVFSDRLTPASGLLRSAPMLYVGKISYSLYMYHWLAVNMVNLLLPKASAAVVIPACLAASFLLSMASYHWVEKPAQSLRRRFQSAHG